LTKIGIISDTHDDIVNVRKAIELFLKFKIECVIHAGDYVFPGIVKEFGRLGEVKFIGVFGNNDGEKLGLSNSFKEIGGELKGEFGELNIDGLKIGIYHGTNTELTESISSNNIYDVFICGHTHKRRAERRGKTLILNPGAAHREFPNIDGEVEKESNIIIFDTHTKHHEFVTL
jgi:uncharacterized protein